MVDERTVTAMERIERALARLESLSDDIRVGGETAAADESEVMQLREAHRALREKVEEAVGQLDRLLAGETA